MAIGFSGPSVREPGQPSAGGLSAIVEELGTGTEF
jgi:hypothetical protein